MKTINKNKYDGYVFCFFIITEYEGYQENSHPENSPWKIPTRKIPTWNIPTHIFKHSHFFIIVTVIIGIT